MSQKGGKSLNLQGLTVAKAIGCEQARNPQSKYSKTSDQFCFYNKTNEKYKKT